MPNDEIQVFDHPVDLTTLPDASEVREKLNAIRAFQRLCSEILVEGHDYGTIPGTQKPTMLKPGAEKIAKLLKLSDTYIVLDTVQDWDKGLFHYTIRCELRDIGTGLLVSSGIGECNSKESKYRYRWLWPNEVEDHGLAKEGLFSRTTRNGGKQYRIENDDIFSVVNTILKMAKKRALVDAALSAGRLSEVFTQDMEDIRGNDSDTKRAPAQRATPRQATKASPHDGTFKDAGALFTACHKEFGIARNQVEEIAEKSVGDVVSPDEFGEMYAKVKAWDEEQKANERADAEAEAAT